MIMVATTQNGELFFIRFISGSGQEKGRALR